MAENPLVTTETEHRIASRIDGQTSQELAISDGAGGIAFASMAQVMEFGKLMAVSQIGVRKHLRGNPGACVAVTIQAIEWRMSPYAVANKSYLVNDQIAYEAQLIHAVILRRAPIKGRPKMEFIGDGGKRKLRVWAELSDGSGEIVEYTSPEFDKIQPKNSPLWKNDPDQQHWYYSIRAWCRRHFPDVILGVYAVDELQDAGYQIDDGRAAPPAPRPGLKRALDSLAEKRGPVIEGSAAEAEQLSEQASFDEETQETSAPAADQGAGAEGVSSKPGDAPAPDLFPTRDALAAARDRGREAKRDGMNRRALPGEYRQPGREAEADEWRAGYDEETAQEGGAS
ncbi:RecT family [Chelatococcus sambhunathii]|uniref:RecT family n=1 Tax=Chelatococcus sambhunathii TaxID=363953 RepID=A0ABP2A8L4_9HYPH|nr:recombinase RecT [Chelatococcus sambhunathii]CUA90844.1 RecT family [Chelatococcus sambhunathii]